MAQPHVPQNALDRFFGLAAHGTSVPTELRAGLATFLTDAYILFVNPAILEKAGMDHGAVFVATALAAAAGSLIMGLYANYPIALAPGMGLNAYFTFTLVPELGGNWRLALGIVFVSGALFFLLSLSPLRAWLVDAIPMNLKLGIAAGIGLFLALIGLQNAGIVAHDPVTLVTLGDLSRSEALLAIGGFLAIAGLAARKVPSAIIIGVLAATLLAVAFGLEPWHGVAALPPSLAPTFLAMDLAGVFRLGLVTAVLTLLLVMMLDATGTLIGVAHQAGFLDDEGRLPRLRQALVADSGGAMIGAALGTSTTTAYIESAAGVRGGRPHRAYGRRRRGALPACALPRPARRDRAALCHGARAHLRRLSHGGEPRRHRLDGPHGIRAGAHHGTHDAAQLLHRHGHRTRLHRLCGAQGHHGALSRDQRRGGAHRPRLPAQADLCLSDQAPTARKPPLVTTPPRG